MGRRSLQTDAIYRQIVFSRVARLSILPPPDDANKVVRVINATGKDVNSLKREITERLNAHEYRNLAGLTGRAQRVRADVQRKL